MKYMYTKLEAFGIDHHLWIHWVVSSNPIEANIFSSFSSFFFFTLVPWYTFVDTYLHEYIYILIIDLYTSTTEK